MTQLLLIFVGGGFGALSRYGVGVLALRIIGPGYPFGTLVANVIGCLGMGLLIGSLAKHDGYVVLRPLLATGFLGGFTTFSAFSLEAFSLWERGPGWVAFAYISTSVILSLAAVFAGLVFARNFWV
jgi:CrcB protein